MGIHHFSLSINGALENPDMLKTMVNAITVDGKTLSTVAQVRDFLRYQQHLGREVLPLSDECEGFDYVTGCPGHKT